VGASATAVRQMNAAHARLMLNHFSIIGSMFGLVLLAVAMVRNSRELTTVSFACLASVAIISIPVYFRPAGRRGDHASGGYFGRGRRAARGGGTVRLYRD